MSYCMTCANSNISIHKSRKKNKREKILTDLNFKNIRNLNLKKFLKGQRPTKISKERKNVFVN